MGTATLFAKNTSRVSELTESLCSAGKKLGVKLAKDVILICRRVELLHCERKQARLPPPLRSRLGCSRTESPEAPTHRLRMS